MTFWEIFLGVASRNNVDQFCSVSAQQLIFAGSKVLIFPQHALQKILNRLIVEMMYWAQVRLV